MSAITNPPPIAATGGPPEDPNKRVPRRVFQSSLAARGEPMVWLTGGALVLALLMIAGLLLLIAWNGFATFWPGSLVRVALDDGAVYMGEITRVEHYTADDGQKVTRELLRTGNFDLTGTHFQWVDSSDVAEQADPEWATLVERLEWGRFYGFPTQFILDGEVVATSDAEVWAMYEQYHGEARGLVAKRKRIEKHEVGDINYRQESARLKLRGVELSSGKDSRAYREQEAAYRAVIADSQSEFAEARARIAKLNEESERYKIVLESAQGQPVTLELGEIVRAFQPNRLGFADTIGIYLARWVEFLWQDPRAANSEGGVYPAIIGTVMMTLIMTIAVVPFGVLAALYLREYAKAGLAISIVRISINNLAGVPSIVYGVFGLGFFCYVVGSYIDGGPEGAGVTPWSGWSWGILLAVWIGAFVVGGFVVGLLFRLIDNESAPFLRFFKFGFSALWVISLVICGFIVLATTPFFTGFFEANLPNPTFGKGALVWASLTLALLTAPVVIVATEEALAAVPNSMREGSYACGASKWQTIRRIVLPRALPGVMTGAILAISRGAGEVAPLMLVGAVALAPELPISWHYDEQFGLNRSFMHLGYHIYSLGFQSPNSEAAKPMVFTTTLLLILIVAGLNITAIKLRTQLRKKFASSAF